MWSIRSTDWPSTKGTPHLFIWPRCARMAHHRITGIPSLLSARLPAGRPEPRRQLCRSPHWGTPDSTRLALLPCSQSSPDFMQTGLTSLANLMSDGRFLGIDVRARRAAADAPNAAEIPKEIG